MLRTIIVKEFLDQIKSLRYLLSLILLLILMVTSSILFVSTYNRQNADYTRSRNETIDSISSKANRSAAIYNVFSMNYRGPYVYKTPNKLGFISEGHESDLPNAFSPSAFRIYGPLKRIRSNMLVGSSEAIDWALIIGTVLSFMSIVLVFDSICGERERGTLRLMMTNPVSRGTLIFGKLLGVVISISSALLISIIMYLLVLILGKIPLSSGDMAIICFVYGVSVLYISCFVLLGLMVSASSKSSSSSLVVSLLLWIALVVIIPGTGGLATSKLVDVKKREIAEEEAFQADYSAIRIYNNQYPDLKNAALSGHWSPGEPLERAFVGADAWSQSYDEYRNSMIRQVESARRLTLISPASCFLNILEISAGSGIHHYKSFFEQLNEYKRTMRRYLLDVYPHPARWYYNYGNPTADQRREIEEAENIKLDFESIPLFSEKRQDPLSAFNSALPLVALLFLVNAVLFMVTFVKFLKYDIR